jgi:membrane associated rhomboid family serine protease
MPTFKQLISSTTNKIIFITVVIHILNTALFARAYNGLELYSWHTAAYQPWQFISHIFLHGDWMHLFFNMFGLWWLGNILEKGWGSTKFIVFYLLCGIFAGVISQLVDSYVFNQASLVPSVGASGAIYGLLAAFALIHPNFKVVFIFLPVPVAAKYFVPILLTIDLFSGVTGFSLFGNNIAHFAHIGGALVGLALTLIYKKI